MHPTGFYRPIFLSPYVGSTMNLQYGKLCTAIYGVMHKNTPHLRRQYEVADNGSTMFNDIRQAEVV